MGLLAFRSYLFKKKLFIHHSFIVNFDSSYSFKLHLFIFMKKIFIHMKSFPSYSLFIEQMSSFTPYIKHGTKSEGMNKYSFTVQRRIIHEAFIHSSFKLKVEASYSLTVHSLNEVFIHSLFIFSSLSECEQVCFRLGENAFISLPSKVM